VIDRWIGLGENTVMKNAATVVDIDWPDGAPAPTLHCPRTGKIVLKADEATDQPASPYVTFVYVDEVGEFDYIRADLRECLDDARDTLDNGGDNEHMSDVEILLNHTSLGRVPIVYRITTSGIACGPVSFTVYIGFDLWNDDEQVDQ
jgi:hypothetical protein